MCLKSKPDGKSLGRKACVYGIEFETLVTSMYYIIGSSTTNNAVLYTVLYIFINF